MNYETISLIAYGLIALAVLGCGVSHFVGLWLGGKTIDAPDRSCTRLNTPEDLR